VPEIEANSNDWKRRTRRIRIGGVSGAQDQLTALTSLENLAIYTVITDLKRLSEAENSRDTFFLPFQYVSFSPRVVIVCAVGRTLAAGWLLLLVDACATAASFRATPPSGTSQALSYKLVLDFISPLYFFVHTAKPVP
jgi:hypothetical protein